MKEIYFKFADLFLMNNPISSFLKVHLNYFGFNIAS